MTPRTRLREKKEKKQRQGLGYMILLLVAGAGLWYLADTWQIPHKIKLLIAGQARQETASSVQRGIMYDRNFRELAVNRQRVSVLSRMRELQSLDETAAQLAPVLAVEPSLLIRKMKEASRSWLAKDINREQEENIRRLNLPGIVLHSEPVRFYPQEASAGHVLGYAENGVGLSGVEYFYDRIPALYGELLQKAGFSPGQFPNIMLTLDLKIQEIVEQLVKTISAERKSQRVGIWVLDVEHGGLLAAAQMPALNPNSYPDYQPDVLTSIATQAMPLPKKFRLLFRDAAMVQHAMESGRSIQPWSVASEKISLGSELRLWEKLQISGKNQPDFANEEIKIQATAKQYICADFEQQLFGSVPEVMTPLQLLTGLGILASGGKSLHPFAIDKILDPNEEREAVSLTRPAQAVGGEAVPEVVASEVMHLFASMADKGSMDSCILADSIRCIARGEKGFEQVRNQLFFAAVPAQRSEFVVLLTVQGGAPTVSGKQEKESLSTDTVKQLSGILERLTVLNQVGKSVQDVAEPVQTVTGNYPVQRMRVKSELAKVEKKTEKPAPTLQAMPQLQGLSLRRSLRLLQGAPCQIRVFGSGRIVKQEPAVGKTLNSSTQCVLTLQKAEEIELEKFEQRILPGKRP